MSKFIWLGFEFVVMFVKLISCNNNSILKKGQSLFTLKYFQTYVLREW